MARRVIFDPAEFGSRDPSLRELQRIVDLVNAMRDSLSGLEAVTGEVGTLNAEGVEAFRNFNEAQEKEGKPAITLQEYTSKNTDGTYKYFAPARVKVYIVQEGEAGDHTKFPTFTRGEAHTLVEEVVARIVEAGNITDPDAIRHLYDLTLTNLYSDISIDKTTGKITRIADPSFADLPVGIWGNLIKGEWNQSSQEIVVDPRYPLVWDKFRLGIEFARDNGLISPYAAAVALLYSPKLIEEAAKLPFGLEGFRGEHGEIVTDMLAWLENWAEVFETEVPRIVNEGIAAIEAGNTPKLLDAGLIMVWKADQKLDPLDQRLPPYGFDPKVERQKQREERILSAYGQEGKKFNDQVEDFMASYGAKRRPASILDPELSRATSITNKRVLELANDVRTAAEARDLGDLEIFREVTAFLTDIFEKAPGEEFSQYDSYIKEITGDIQALALDTEDGRRAYAKEFYGNTEGINWDDLTDDRKQKILDKTNGKSPAEFDAFILEGGAEWQAEGEAAKWKDKATERGIQELSDYLRHHNILPSTLSPQDKLKLENEFSTRDWKTWFEAHWEGDPPGLTPEQRGKLHLEIYQDRFTAEKEQKELTEKNIPAVTDNEMDALIENVLLGYEKELEDIDITELKFELRKALREDPNLTRAQQKVIVAEEGTRLVEERRVIVAEQAAAQREEPGVARGITRKVLDDNDIGELSDDRLKELEDSVEKYGVKEFQSWVEDNVDALKDESKQFEAAAAAEEFEPDRARDLIDDALEAAEHPTNAISEKTKLGLISGLVEAVKAGQGLPADLVTQFITPQLDDLVAEQQQLEQARQVFGAAGVDAADATRLENIFDELVDDGLPKGFGVTPAGGFAPLPTFRSTEFIDTFDPSSESFGQFDQFGFQTVEEQVPPQTISEIVQGFRTQRDPTAFPIRPTVDAFGNPIPTEAAPFDPVAETQRGLISMQAEREAEAAAIEGQGVIDLGRAERERARRLAAPGASERTVASLERILEEQRENDLLVRQARQVPGAIGFETLGPAIREAAGSDIGLEQFLFSQAPGIQRRFQEERRRVSKLAVPLSATGVPEPPVVGFSKFFAEQELPQLQKGFATSQFGLRQELQRTRPPAEQTEAQIESDAELAKKQAETERRRQLRGRGRTVMRV